MSATRLVAVADYLGHACQDPELLLAACTHASFDALQSKPKPHPNERLEFLGDALLGAAVAAALFSRFPDSDEGSLSRLRARLVSRATLAAAMDLSPLLAHCRVGPQTQKPWPVSVKANLAEAILAAIYLDGGWPALLQAVCRLLASALAHCQAEPEADWKNKLQQLSLARHCALPQYQCQRAGGSDHDPEFQALVRVGASQATGTGSSRRSAEKRAAEALFKRLQADEEAHGGPAATPGLPI